MPKCPKCHEEIDELIANGDINEHRVYHFTASNEGDGEYSEIDPEQFFLENREFKCPKCKEILFSERDDYPENDATLFLQGKPLLGSD